MQRISSLLTVIIICCLFSCKKDKSNPEPEIKGIAIFDLEVYDSDLWTPQNKLPLAANVEVEVFETTYALNDYGQLKETESLKHIFTGKTSEKGIVKVIREDSLKTNISFFAKLKKGNRSNYSPEGYQCSGIYESQADILNGPIRYNVTPKIGDKRLMDYNGDGVVNAADKNNPGIYVARYQDKVLSMSRSCWLY